MMPTSQLRVSFVFRMLASPPPRAVDQRRAPCAAAGRRTACPQRRRGGGSRTVRGQPFRIRAEAAQEETTSVAEANLLRVGFSVRVRVGFGDTVLLTGSHASLGEWDVSKAVPLSWATDADGTDVWSTTVLLPEHFVVRFKV